MAMTRGSSEGSFQVEKKTSKFPETMMGDKTTQKLQQLTIRFLNSRHQAKLAPNRIVRPIPEISVTYKGSHSRQKCSIIYPKALT